MGRNRWREENREGREIVIEQRYKYYTQNIYIESEREEKGNIECVCVRCCGTL